MSFRQNMLRGLGRCHLDILNSNNKSKFKEDILYASLNSISYDTFFEGTKSWYIYDLILGLQDNDYFENKIIEKLKSKNIDVNTFNHLTDLLDHFSYDGSHNAKESLEKQYNNLINKRKFASDDYEKICNLIQIFDDLYGKKRIDKILDDIYKYKNTHKSFDVTRLWYIESMVFNVDKYFIKKIKTYFPEFDFNYNKNNCPHKINHVTMNDIRSSEIDSLPIYVSSLDEQYHSELIDYLLEINDKNRSIKIIKCLKVSNQLFNRKIEKLITLLKKYDLQHARYCLDFFIRHKCKKLRLLAYELIHNPLFKEQGMELLIKNYTKEDEEYLYKYFKSVKFNFRSKKSHYYVCNLINYFNNGGNDERIKSLLYYYYDNNYCSFCRKEIIDVMAKFNLLNGKIISEMKYDCNYEIRKLAKKYF